MHIYVGHTVQAALEHMMNSEYTKALITMRPALDETARKYYDAKRTASAF